MQQMTRRVLCAAGMTLIFATTAAWSQGAPPVRVRGQIEKVDGDMLTIKARDGSTVQVKTAAELRVIAQVKATLDDLKPGAYIGVAAMPNPDGSQRAIGIQIFLDAQRNVIPEGFRPWDREPGSTMTNANVGTTVTSKDGQVLTVKYKDGEKKVIIAPNTPIVKNVPGDKSEVKVGAQIAILGGQKAADGSLSTSAIYVGRGIAPPI